MTFKFKSTAELKVPEKLVDQVISQESAVEVIKKAALQRRHVLLIGEPGTGKSLLGLALAELLPKEKLVDVIAFPNPHDENQPLIRQFPAGKGRDLVAKAKIQSNSMFRYQNWILIALAIISMFLPWWARSYYNSDIIFAAFFLGGMIFIASFVLFLNLGKRMGAARIDIPKIIVDNHGKKTAPFWDATGSHAGALLGDILHDPLQCFSDHKLALFEQGKIVWKPFHKPLDKYANRLFKAEKDKRNYEAMFTKMNELSTLGETTGKVIPAEILSFNRHEHDGKMIKLTTSNNKELLVTPEHKIAINKNGKLTYVEAQKIKQGDEVFSLQEDIIIDEQDIINTYDERQRQQCTTYFNYLTLKKQNPTWGYKRIAKTLGHTYSKTRWWHAGKCVPTPIQTCTWLKEKGFLPLNKNNKKLPLITKILGATFGDGGIFQNLNGIFLSSSELSAVEEFGKDINTIFQTSGNERIIEGGEKGHSWCYQNTNRNIIRFFLALGTPKGNKMKTNLFEPAWIRANSICESEFWGSFLGNELGVPKVHTLRNKLNTLDAAICGKQAYENNRTTFLNNLREYLERNNIKTCALVKTKNKDTDTYIFRLLLSTTFENVANFIKRIKINYCDYKQKKLLHTINHFRELKKKRYYELVNRGYGAEHAMKTLNLSPSALYTILNEGVQT